MMTKIPMAQLKLRAASGTASLSAVKLFDDTGRVIYGGSGLKAVASIDALSWQALSSLLSSDWTNNLNQNGWGLQATVAGAALNVSYSKGGDDPAEQDGTVTSFPIGSTILLGSVPDCLLRAPYGRERVAAAYEQSALTTATLTLVNDAITLACAGMGQAVFDFTTITGTSPTMAPEVSMDGGTTWKGAKSYQASAGTGASSGGPSYSVVTTVRYFVDCAGATNVRMRATVIGTGPHTVVGSTQSSAWSPNVTIASGGQAVYPITVHGSASSISNVIVAGAEGRTTDLATVTEGQAVRLQASRVGKGVVLPYALPGQDADGNVALSSTVAADVIAAPGAGIRLYITSITISSTAPAGTAVDIRFNTTTKRRIFMPANDFKEITFVKPLRLGANEAITALATFASGAILVSASGYTAAE